MNLQSPIPHHLWILESLFAAHCICSFGRRFHFVLPLIKPLLSQGLIRKTDSFFNWHRFKVGFLISSSFNCCHPEANCFV